MKTDKDVDLPVIEVPAELHGWSDEDIIRNSESMGHRTYRERPSKRARFQKKVSAEHEKMRKIAIDFGVKSVESVVLHKPEPVSSTPRPSSGRVLKSSFCGKMGFSFKAEAVPEKKPDVLPVKRGRGRPRKNPLGVNG